MNSRERMGIRIFLANSITEDGTSIQCEVEPEEKMDGIIETAIEFWGLDRDGSYAVKSGVSLVSREMTMSGLNISAGDRLVVVDPGRWRSDLEAVKSWIESNIGGSIDNMKLVESEENGNMSTGYLINDTGLERSHRIVFGGGRVMSYIPVL